MPLESRAMPLGPFTNALVKGEPFPLASYFVIVLMPKLATKKVSAEASEAKARSPATICRESFSFIAWNWEQESSPVLRAGRAPRAQSARRSR